MNATELFGLIVEHSRAVCTRPCPCEGKGYGADNCTLCNMTGNMVAQPEYMWPVIASNVLAAMEEARKRNEFPSIIDLVEMAQAYRTRVIEAMVDRDGPEAMIQMVREDLEISSRVIERHKNPKMTSTGLTEEDLRDLLGDGVAS